MSLKLIHLEIHYSMEIFTMIGSFVLILYEKLTDDIFQCGLYITSHVINV